MNNAQILICQNEQTICCENLDCNGTKMNDVLPCTDPNILCNRMIQTSQFIVKRPKDHYVITLSNMTPQ